MVDWLNCANITARSNGKLIEQISTLVNSKYIDDMKQIKTNIIFFHTIFTEINQNNMEENLTPQGVLNALREHRWVFSNEEQVTTLIFCYCF